MFSLATVTRSCKLQSYVNSSSQIWTRHFTVSSAALNASTGTEDSPTEVLGRVYERDDMTNITPRLLEKVGRNLHQSPSHPLHLIKRRIHQYFDTTFRKPNPSSAPLFACVDEIHPVVTVEQNFDQLLTPADHPSRRQGESYYLNSRHLLRAHTSAHQNDLVKSGLDAFLVTGDVYRRDAVDPTHYPCFHQMEGVRLFSAAELFPDDVHQRALFTPGGEETPAFQAQHSAVVAERLEQDLKATLEGLVQHLFGTDIKTEWASEYFPFTHPSWELNVYFQDKWLEVLGCGIMRQEILDNAGASSKVGWAFGVGLERLAMILYSIPDIRFFWSDNHRFLDQFKPAMDDINTNIQFVPYSKHPICYKDMSFWTMDGKNFAGENDIMEIAREAAGDLIEWIEKIDYFENPKAKPGDANFSSFCYRLNFRSHERTLLNSEINDIQERIRTEMTRRLNITLR